MKENKDTIWLDIEDVQVPPIPSPSKPIPIPAPIPAPSSMPTSHSKDVNIPTEQAEINIKPMPFKLMDVDQLNTEIPATVNAKMQILIAEIGILSQDSASHAKISQLLLMESVQWLVHNQDKDVLQELTAEMENAFLTVVQE